MVDVFQTLAKHKNRLEDIQKKENSKKIKRTISRPWQENLNSSTDTATLIPESSNGLIENKVAQNQLKTDSKVTQKVTQNQLKTDSKVTQKKEVKNKTDSKVTQEVTHEVTQNQLKTDSKVTQTSSFLAIVGLQKAILLIMYQDCLNRMEKITSPISVQSIASILNCPIKSVKSATFNLIKKGLIQIHEFKNGRNGWTKYSLNDSLFNEIMRYETNSKLTQNQLKTDSKVPSKVTHKLTQSPPSSSSLDINNKTTNTSDEDEWSSITFPAILLGLNFGGHLTKQVQKKGLLSAGEFQESLDAFAFDIQENNLINAQKIGNPVRYFMGAISKNTKYAPPANYISDEQKALRENIARLEATKKQREEMEAANAELLYEDWHVSLSKEEKIRLVPENDFIRVDTPFHTQMLKSHFYESLKKGLSPNDTLSMQ